MKRFLTLCLLSALALGSCMRSEADKTGSASGDSFRLKLIVDEINTGAKALTRSSVAAAEGETTIANMYLLFFDYSTNGSGDFVKALEIGTGRMNAEIPIQYEDGLSALTDYSVLALANIDEYIGARTVAEFIADFEGKTEAEVIGMSTMLQRTGVGADQDDDTKAIASNKLVMSARATKMAGDELLTVALTRGVSRFDVQNTQRSYYDLVSVSIWNAASESPLWLDGVTVTPDRMQRFYGIKRPFEPSAPDGAEMADVHGGLYSFENFVSNPMQNDQATTCLIIGLAPRESIRNDKGVARKVTYYRVNVNPPGASQNLKRNYVYNVSIRSVSGEGAPTEAEAWAQADNKLQVTINNWNLDDEGMVLTDGTNTMAVPVKRVLLDPLGDQREYSIFTLGPGTLTMSKRELPGGFNVSLNGNLLKVTATPLAQGETERRGSIELSFGSLRGTIDFIQTPDNDVYLTLDKSSLAIFPNVENRMVDILVTSSGPWTATIYNNETGNNPGFSFIPGGSGVTPQTVLTRDGNNNSDMIRLYTTGVNLSNESRYSFVVVKLDGYDDITRALVLTQAGKTEVKLSPAMSGIQYSPTGTPEGINGAIDGDPFIFTVDPGSSEGVRNTWTAELTGDDKDYFELRVSNTGYEQKIEIRAKGTSPGSTHNLLGRTLSAGVDLWLTGDLEGQPGTRISMTVKQTPAGIGLTQLSSSATVPVTGTPKSGSTWTDYVEYSVKDLADGQTWDAYIDKAYIAGTEISLSETSAFFIDESGNRVNTLTGRPKTETLKIGFDKIYYPLVDKSPSVDIVVRMSSAHGVYAPLSVTQEKLSRKPVKMFDMLTNVPTYGSLSGGGAHYFGAYRSYIFNTTLYGPNSAFVKTASNPAVAQSYDGRYPSAANRKINDDITYVHSASLPYNYNDQAFIAVEEWRTKHDGVVFFIADDVNATPFNNTNSTVNKLGYRYATRNAGGYYNTRVNPSLLKPGSDEVVDDNRLMQYLFVDGPFGKIASPKTIQIYCDDAHTTVSSWPADAVPVILEKNTNNAMLVMDPKNKFIYLGECQFFWNTAAVGTDVYKFQNNIISYVIRAAQFGSHFTDIFLDDSIPYPFDTNETLP